MVIKDLLLAGFLVILSTAVNAQDFYSKEGYIPVPYRITIKQLASTDTISTDVVIISVRKPVYRKGKIADLSDNRIAKSGFMSMVTHLADTSVVLLRTSLDSALLRLRKDRPTVIFIHGYGRSFDEVIGNANRLRNRYGVNVVAFDWPSKSRNFGTALANVRSSTSEFVEFLKQYKQFSGGELVSTTTLLMHSLGNYYYVRAIKDNPGTSLFKTDPTFSTIVFNAAAISQNEHALLFDGYLPDGKALVIQNKNDKVLHGAELLMWSPMLGRLAKKPLANDVMYIDFTSVANKNHTLFLGDTELEQNNPNFQKFYKNIFWGKSIHSIPLFQNPVAVPKQMKAECGNK